LISFSALRAAAAAVKHEDERRLFRNAALRKRRKEMGDQMDSMRRVNRVYNLSIMYFFAFSITLLANVQRKNSGRKHSYILEEKM